MSSQMFFSIEQLAATRMGAFNALGVGVGVGAGDGGRMRCRGVRYWVIYWVRMRVVCRQKVRGMSGLVHGACRWARELRPCGYLGPEDMRCFGLGIGGFSYEIQME